MKWISTLLILLLSPFFLNGQELDFKNFHRQFEEVAFSLYASKYETGNWEYRAFINDLKKSKDDEKLAICRVDTAAWREVIKYSKPYISYYFQHEAYDDFPVVNITREAAALYCEWLTRHYNATPKRKFKRVRFRLPTDAEWLMAASGGLEKAIFPWGGPYLRNAKGRYLANFRLIPQSTLRDDGKDCILYEAIPDYGKEIGESSYMGKIGTMVTAPVDAFYPNPYGLYNCSGNVAEMVVSKKRKTRGGSWQTTGYYLRLDADDPYAGVEGAHPAIGFRVFMEVIEE